MERRLDMPDRRIIRILLRVDHPDGVTNIPCTRMLFSFQNFSYLMP